MKNVYGISSKQHGGIKSGILQSKNSTILQVLCTGVHTVLLEGVKVKLSQQVCESDHFWRIFCGCNGKTSTICHH